LVAALLRRINMLVLVLAMAAAGLAASQLTAFMQQYTQNLAGRLAEARREVDGIIDRAARADMPVYAYLNEFVTASNPVFRREGHALRARIDRAGWLADSYNALETAGLFKKPFVFVWYLDDDIAADVWRHFSPGIQLDRASLIYAGMGMAVGLVAVEGLRILLLLPVRVVRRRRRAVAGSS